MEDASPFKNYMGILGRPSQPREWAEHFAGTAPPVAQE